MAYTIDIQPDEFSPVHNDLTFVVSDTDYGEAQFKYIFELSVNGISTPVVISKVFPRPDHDAHFNPGRILKNYISNTPNNEVASASNADETELMEYTVVFKVEYLVAGVLTEYTRDSGTDKVVFNMVANWQGGSDISTFMDKYSIASAALVPTTSLAMPLGPNVNGVSSFNDGVVCPKESYDLHEGEKRTISIITRNSWATPTKYPEHFRVTTYTNTGESKIFILNLQDYSVSGVVEKNELVVPIGVAELNLISWDTTVIPGGLTNTIVLTEDVSFSIEFFYVSGLSEYYTHQPIYFNLTDGSCDRYERIIVCYKAPMGGWWYIPMTMKNYEKETTSRTVINNVLPYDYDTDVGTRQVIGMEGLGAYTLNTSWLNAQGFIEDVVDMLKSPTMYLMRQGTTSAFDVYTPVVVATSDYAVKNIDQDKLTQYTISFTEAFDKNIAI